MITNKDSSDVSSVRDLLSWIPELINYVAKIIKKIIDSL